MHYDHKVHFSADLSSLYRWIVKCSGHPNTKPCLSAPSRLFPVPPGRDVGYGCIKIGVISQERFEIEVKLLLSANRKSYMPRQNAQQRMTLSDLEWPFHASRAISAVAELLVLKLCQGMGRTYRM